MKTAGSSPPLDTSALGIILGRNNKRKLNETSINNRLPPPANHSNPPKRFKPNNVADNKSVSRSVPKAGRAVESVRNVDPRKEVERLDKELERMEQEYQDFE